MSYARQLLDAHPGSVRIDAGVLAATIDALGDCAQACIADTEDDLSEPDVTAMVTCIRLCLDCADVCAAAATVASRQREPDPAVLGPLLQACVASCRSCGEECDRHARMHRHCQVCAEACHRGERAAQELLAVIG